MSTVKLTWTLNMSTDILIGMRRQNKAVWVLEDRKISVVLEFEKEKLIIIIKKIIKNIFGLKLDKESPYKWMYKKVILWNEAMWCCTVLLFSRIAFVRYFDDKREYSVDYY